MPAKAGIQGVEAVSEEQFRTLDPGPRRGDNPLLWILTSILTLNPVRRFDFRCFGGREGPTWGPMGY